MFLAGMQLDACHGIRLAAGQPQLFDADKDHSFGEDQFMRRCLALLRIKKVDEFNLLDELACGKHPSPCRSPSIAFHPFKTVYSYMQCWQYANTYGDWEVPATAAEAAEVDPSPE